MAQLTKLESRTEILTSLYNALKELDFKELRKYGGDFKTSSMCDFDFSGTDGLGKNTITVKVSSHDKNEDYVSLQVNYHQKWKAVKKNNKFIEYEETKNLATKHIDFLTSGFIDKSQDNLSYFKEKIPEIIEELEEKIKGEN